MNGADLLPASVLKRKAVVYVRQSTQAQVQFNRESQRQQYELVEVARRRGFHAIEIIDDDLGKSASGMVARPGFERLVASLCHNRDDAGLRFDLHEPPGDTLLTAAEANAMPVEGMPAIMDHDFLPDMGRMTRRLW